MHLLLIIPLLIILFIVLAVLITAGNIIKSIFSGFGFNRNKKTNKSSNDRNNRTYTSYEKRTKVFGPNEGEYVDFEEIKEND
ncbi:MAG: DUF4834 family protein [Bacteroidales bacterium]|nr:DUF4834 family protein [Bacteroidales bacterium]